MFYDTSCEKHCPIEYRNKQTTRALTRNGVMLHKHAALDGNKKQEFENKVKEFVTRPGIKNNTSKHPSRPMQVETTYRE